MERIGRVLGRSACASITFSAQRHVQIVELTVQARTQKIAATGKADTPAALREAIAHAEHQVHRYRDRRLVSKRLPKVKKCSRLRRWRGPKRASNRTPPKKENVGRSARAGIHCGAFFSGAHRGGRAAHPQDRRGYRDKTMTIEEAVKDAEFRDRDLLIFRTDRRNVCAASPARWPNGAGGNPLKRQKPRAIGSRRRAEHRTQKVDA